MRKKYLLIIVLFCAFLTIGCGKKERNYEKHLVSFSYSYGNYKSGLNDYSIIYDDNIIFTSSSSSNNVPFIEKEVDKDILDKIEKIIKKYNVNDWDGFNKHSDLEDNDEISFSIQLGYDNGDNYSASGYMHYPQNFKKVHNELLNIFEGI